MSPVELAKRLSDLDWSATSLQHQLAVTAAILTLSQDNQMQALPVHENVVALVPKGTTPTMRHVTLLHLDGRQWATAGFLPGCAGAPWAWIQEIVAHEHECSEDDVGCAEPDEDEGGGDFVTVRGEPYYRVKIGR